MSEKTRHIYHKTVVANVWLVFVLVLAVTMGVTFGAIAFVRMWSEPPTVSRLLLENDALRLTVNDYSKKIAGKCGVRTNVGGEN